MNKKLLITILIILIFIAGLEVWQSSKSTQVSLFLSSLRDNYNLEEDISVKISINTVNFEIDGMDVVLNYNPQELKFQKIDTSESVFSIFPSPSINEEGKIKFSALVSPQQKFQGEGEVAIVLFQAIQEGETELYFDFELGSTIDSNVALSGQGKDILEKVNSLKIKIK